MVSGPKSNKYKGIPGSGNFSFKLPKGVTVQSTRKALEIICLSRLLNIETDTDLEDNLIEKDLGAIYPELNPVIVRHFVLTRTRIVLEKDNDISTASDQSSHNSSVHQPRDRLCQLCALPRDSSGPLCMKCKCLPQRVDDLTMELRKVQHAIDALLDIPKASASAAPRTAPPSSEPPTPPGTLRTDKQSLHQNPSTSRQMPPNRQPPPSRHLATATTTPPLGNGPPSQPSSHPYYPQPNLPLRQQQFDSHPPPQGPPPHGPSNHHMYHLNQPPHPTTSRVYHPTRPLQKRTNTDIQRIPYSYALDRPSCIPATMESRSAVKIAESPITGRSHVAMVCNFSVVDVCNMDTKRNFVHSRLSAKKRVPVRLFMGHAMHGMRDETVNDVDGDDVARCKRRRCTCGIASAYLHLLVEFPSVVIFVIFALVVAAGVASFLTNPLLSLEDPSKGFQARGTVLSGRLMAYERFIEPTELYSPYPSAPIGETGPTPIGQSASIRRRKSASLRDVHLRDVEYDEPGCGSRLADRLRIVYRTSEDSDMFIASAMKAACRHDQQTFRIQPSYEEICAFRDANETCCPTWSLGHLVASVSGKASCADIDEDDVNVVKRLLRECAEEYMAGCLQDYNDCRNVSETCSNHTTAISTIFHFLTPSEFVTSVLHGGFHLPVLMTLPPLEYSNNQTRKFYDEHMHSPSLYDDDIRIVAIGAGFKIDLFIDYILSDSLYIGFGCAAVVVIIWVYVGSFFVTIMTILSMFMSMAVAHFLYHTVFRVTFAPYVNVLTSVLIVGIGADDCFIYVDIWRISKRATPNPRENLVAILRETLSHSATPMFVTSFTTSAALFAGIVSSITSVRCFSVYAGSTILVNFVFTVTWIPASVMIHEKYFLHEKESSITSSKGRTICYACDWCYQNLSKACCNFFEFYLPAAIEKLRVVWIAVLVGLGLAGFCVVFITPRMRLPSQSEFQVFRMSHILEQYDQVYEKMFAFESDAADLMPAMITWGIKPLDNGNHWDPDSKGSTVMDDEFDPTTAEAQEWLYQFCADFRNSSFHDDTTSPDEEVCFVDLFRSFMEGPCMNPLTGADISPCCLQSSFPYEPSLFHQCAITLYELGCQVYPCEYNRPGLRFNSDNDIVAMNFYLKTNVRESQDFAAMDKFWKDVNSWVENRLKAAPSGLSRGWFISFGKKQLYFFDLQRSLAVGTPRSVGVSLAVASCVLFVAIRNILVTLYAIISITCAVSVVIASVVLLGWELNIFESIILALTVGLSVDFTIHFGVSYRQAPASDRQSRSLFAIQTLSAAITMAALTTFAAGACMLPATVLSYVQLGIFLMLVMVISWVYGTFFFISLCWTIGPEGPPTTSDRPTISAHHSLGAELEMRKRVNEPSFLDDVRYRGTFNLSEPLLQ
ncbi:protein dispatched homolog 1-like [Diadema antillarum]|uniref:protein dispatched homolog 1-like n=1 Tax=Diadema antillarum TaxID=105358 RepID=UPI003A85B7C3